MLPEIPNRDAENGRDSQDGKENGKIRRNSAVGRLAYTNGADAGGNLAGGVFLSGRSAG